MGYKGLYNPYQYDLFSDEVDQPTAAMVNQPVAATTMDDGTGYDFMSDVNSYLAKKNSTPPAISAVGAAQSSGSLGLPASISAPAIVSNPSFLGNQPATQWPGAISSNVTPAMDPIPFSDKQSIQGYGISPDRSYTYTADAGPSSTGTYKAPTYGPSKPWSNPYAGGYYGIEMDPNQMINTLTGKPDEPTTGTIGENFPQGAGKQIDLNPKDNVSGPGSVGNIAEEAKKKMEENIKKIAEPFTDIPEEEKCPEGQKWDPKRKQCYKEVKGTFEPEANMFIAGLRGVGNILGRKEQRAQDMLYSNMTLADNVMAPKPGNTFKTRGLYDVNTFGIPNAGVYATNYVQPAEQLPRGKKGGDVMYLTDNEILNIINMGGQVEFLD